MPPWLGDVTVQETLKSLPPSEQKVTEPVEIDLEGIEPFVPPAEEVVEEQCRLKGAGVAAHDERHPATGRASAGTRPSTPLAERLRSSRQTFWRSAYARRACTSAQSRGCRDAGRADAARRAGGVSRG